MRIDREEKMKKVEIRENEFYCDGKPFRVVAGAMHYFRVPREYWRDRLEKLKACGFNTVETYVAWNLHEKEEGVFDFSDQLDLGAYLDLINEMGMYAIVRPGPYICSEWEFGGFPWWLLKYDGMVLRSMDRLYLEKVDRFFDAVIPVISVRQTECGGNVIMVQVENEYGSYGNDSVYIRYLADGLRNRGITAILFTSDGDCDFMLSGGTVPEIHKTCNFGSNPLRAFKNLRKFQKTGPLMCAEYWNGWFDHWTERHHSRNAADAADCLGEILDLGASVSVYMAHGGTNFGFMNGANCTDDEYQPTVNSYDDDAPVNEYGGLTEKYFKMRDVLEARGYKNEGLYITNPETVNYPDVVLSECADLLEQLEALSTPTDSVEPIPMEKLGQGYGYILYKTFIKGPKEKASLNMDVHDRAYVFLDGEFEGIVYRNDKKPKISFAVPAGGAELTILVENMGRTNYGRFLWDQKGIIGGVRHGQQFIFHWKNYTLPLTNLSKLVFSSPKKVKFGKRPVFLRGTFEIEDEPKDTFVNMKDFKKGVIWVNGICLSRYWHIGPQKTAYLPAPFLKKGENEIIVLETEGFKSNTAILTDKCDIG